MDRPSRAQGQAAQAAAPAPWRGWPALIFLLALGLRLLGNLWFEDFHSGPTRESFSDGVEFDLAAASLVEHGTFAIDAGTLTSFRAPGFPFVIAGVYAVCGVNNHVAAHIAFCLIGALLTLATWKLALEFTDARTALLASLLVAVYPNVLYWCLHYSSEPLFTLLVTTALWLQLRGLRRDRLADLLLTGLLLGAATLTRPLAVYFAPCLALAAAWTWRHRSRRALAGAALILAGTAAVLLPWTARNWAVHERFVLVATNGGSTFWGATNQIVLDDPQLHGGWVTTNAMGEQKLTVVALQNEVDRDRLEWEYGKQFLAEHPAELPRLLWYKLVAFWTPICETPNRAYNWLVGLSYAALLPFMAAGVVRLLRRPRDEAEPETRARLLGTGLLALTIALTVAGTLLFYGSARFRSVIEPLLLILAAAGLMPLLRLLQRRPASTPPC